MAPFHPIWSSRSGTIGLFLLPSTHQSPISITIQLKTHSRLPQIYTYLN